MNKVLDNIHIDNSALYPLCEIRPTLLQMRYADRINDKHELVWSRGIDSLEAEWVVHNALYRLHIFRSHTRNVDLNYPCKTEWLYKILSPIARLIAE